MCRSHRVSSRMWTMPAMLGWVAACRFVCFFRCPVRGVALPVFLFGILWGAMCDVLCLGYVCRPPIVLLGCAVYNALGCCCGLGPAVGTVGPSVSISSRVGVLLVCSLCYVQQSLCFILIIFTLEEGVYFSTFSRVLSKCRSSYLSGLAGHVSPIGCGFPLTA